MNEKSGRSGAAGVNEVALSGRVSAVDQPRRLPSGDEVVGLRLVVARPPRAGSRVTVDVIDVACWSAAARRSASRLSAGDHAEVTGALRRRFFRAGGAAASRYEVEARTVRRVRVAAPADDARGR